jgi:predicted nuclease of predicted toxin-antitoxin system
VKLLLDMNMSPALAEYLREAGHDAIHWSAVGAVTATDPTISAYAATAGHVVVTHDLDFGALTARGNSGAPSIIQISADDLSVAQLGVKLLAVIEDVGPELLTGALVTIDPVRVRIRVLPLRPE